MCVAVGIFKVWIKEKLIFSVPLILGYKAQKMVFNEVLNAALKKR